MWDARGVWSDDLGYPVASGEGVGVEACHDVRLGEVVLSVGAGQHLGSARGFPITLPLNGGERWMYVAQGLWPASIARLATSWTHRQASNTRSPARHCSKVSSLAWGLGAAAIRALTSWASRYSGSVEPLPPGDCFNAALFGFTPRGLRLRETAAVVFGSVIKD